MDRRVRSNRSFPILLAASILLIAGLACSSFNFNFGGETEAPPSVPATSPPSLPQPEVTQPPSQGNQASLTVNNQSSSDVCFMRISPTTSSEWGDDWLGADILAQGSSYTFGPIAPGTYDLRAEFCGGDSVEEFGFAIMGEASWTVTGGAAGPGPSTSGSIQLLVINQTSETVCFMRISPVTSQYWGDDWLGADFIPAGEQYTFFVEPGMYDLRAEFCSNAEPIESFQVDLTSDTTLTLGTE